MKPTWQTDDGAIQLYMGDSLKILPTLDPVSVDCVVTDPPYEITAKGGGIAANRQYLHDTEGFTDCGFDYSILSPFDNWVCFGALRQVPKLIENAGDRRWMLITWNKPDPAPLCNGNYLPDTEYIVHAWRGRRLYGRCEDKARFINHRSSRDNGLHPNCKPVPVMEKVVVNSSDVGQLVVDPYMGSGTTGVACVRLERRFIGIEENPKHYRTAERRIRDELERRKWLAPVAPRPV